MNFFSIEISGVGVNNFKDLAISREPLHNFGDFDFKVTSGMVSVIPVGLDAADLFMFFL